jgi:hypothetical protein
MAPLWLHSPTTTATPNPPFFVLRALLFKSVFLCVLPGPKPVLSFKGKLLRGSTLFLAQTAVSLRPEIDEAERPELNSMTLGEMAAKPPKAGLNSGSLVYRTGGEHSRRKARQSH